jgi:tetratricopeptide (TPR) repeat protein
MGANNFTQILCPSQAELAALLEEDLADQERTQMETHLSECQDCRSILENLAVDAGSWHELEPIVRQYRAWFTDDTVALRPVPTLLEEIRLPGYRILEKIGQGGMSEVFRARELALNRIVALKLLPIASPERVVRFKFEAESVARLRHPNIVPIYQTGAYGGRLFIALEYVEGGDLAHRLQGKPLPVAETVDLILTLAKAVQAAHDAGILHRDLKPANILIAGGKGEAVIPKISDFGLACGIDGGSGPTRTGDVIGTPSYMAPEQAAAVPNWATVHVDVYALGAILYECLTGKPPFKGETPLETVQQVTQHDLVPPARINSTIPKDIETICLKCLEKNPASRYASATDLAEDLDRYRQGKPIQARAISFWQRAWKWVRRRPTSAGLLVVGFLALFSLLGVWISFTLALQHQNALLEEERNKSREQKDLAVKHLHLATDAVSTYFTMLSEDPDLKAHGLEPLRLRLLEKARDYFQKLAAIETTDPQLRAEQGRAYYHLGEITFAIGSKVEAEGYYRQAIGIHETLTQEFPNDPTHRMDLARALQALAFCYMAMGKHQEALLYIERAEEKRRQLVAEFPEQLDLVHDQLRSQFIRARIHMEMGHSSKAQDVLLDGVTRVSALVQSQPQVGKYQYLRARFQQQLGFYYMVERAKSAEAEKYFLLARDTFQQVPPDDPLHLSAESYIAALHLNLGTNAMRTRQWKKAEEFYRIALAMRQEMCQRHPTVAKYRASLALAHGFLGALHIKVGRIDLGEPLVRKSIDMFDQLRSDYPTVVDYDYRQLGNYRNLGLVHLSKKNLPEAEKAFERGIQLGDALDQSDPDSTDPPRYKMQCLYSLVKIYESTHRPELAEQTAIRALDYGVATLTRMPEHRVLALLVADGYKNFVQALLQRKQDTRAIELLARGLPALQKSVEHLPRATPLRKRVEGLEETYARLLAHAGRHAEAALVRKEAEKLNAMKEGTDENE